MKYHAPNSKGTYLMNHRNSIFDYLCKQLSAYECLICKRGNKILFSDLFFWFWFPFVVQVQSRLSGVWLQALADV